MTPLFTRTHLFRSTMLLTLMLSAGMTLAPSTARSADTLVIYGRDFREAIQPWVDYRTSQGHSVEVRLAGATPFEIHQTIRRAAIEGDLANVLLVGDSFDHDAIADNLVPTDFIAARVNVLFGSEPEIATDNSYADVDRDGTPDLTIGRLPFDTPQQLTQYINRVIKYERGSADTAWQRRINLIAGTGGFGGVVDRLVEQTARRIITDLIPQAYDTSMTYGSWTSPFCPDPRRFSETAIERFNEGCLFWVYVGHSSREQLDDLRLPDQCHPLMDADIVSQLNCRSGSPIAICLSCYTGATDGARDGLAEQMISQPGGPIAVVCGTRVTMPYAMSLFSLEMLDEYFIGDAATLGLLLQRSRQQLAAETEIGPDDEYRELIDSLGRSMSPLPELLQVEKREHVHLMHLLGDPLLQIQRPETIEFALTDIEGISSVVSENDRESDMPTFRAGETITVTGVSDKVGSLDVELAYQRDRFRHRPRFRKEYDSSDAAFCSYDLDYVDAHDLVCSRRRLNVSTGPFRVELPVPTDASGRCVVRVIVTGDNSISLGAEKLRIKRALPIRTAQLPTE